MNNNINNSNRFLKLNQQPQTNIVNQNSEEELQQSSQTDEKNNSPKQQKEFKEHGEKLLDSMEYLAARGRSSIRNRSGKMQPRNQIGVSSIRASVILKIRKPIQPEPELPVIDTTDNLIQNGRVDDKFYEYGSLANGMVNDVIYDNGVVFIDAAQTSMENIQTAINNVINNNEDFISFMESANEIETFTSNLTFFINEKEGSANVTIDKQGNILGVKDGLVITYSQENPEEIQNKEIFEIDENGIWNYTKENYGLDFAGNYSLLLRLVATNEPEQANLFGNSEIEDINEASTTGSTNAPTSSTHVRASVDSQAVAKSSIVSMEEVQNFVTNGIQTIQDEIEKNKNKYSKIQQQKIDELTNKAQEIITNELKEINIQEITAKLTTLTNTEEDIKKQKEIVENLNNAIFNYNYEQDNNVSFEKLNLQYCEANDKYNEMTMRYTYEKQLIEQFNNRTENFEHNVSIGEKFITYSREILQDNNIYEIYKVQYGNTEIILSTLNKENNNLVIKIGNENSKPYTNISKNLKDKSNNFTYKYNDENCSKDISVTEKMTTISITKTDNNSTSTTFIRKGIDEDNRIHNVYTVTNNDEKYGFSEISADKTKYSPYAKILKDGTQVNHYYYYSEIFMGNEKELMIIKNIDEGYDKTFTINNNKELEMYIMKENVDTALDKIYIGQKATYFDKTDENEGWFINTDIKMHAAEIDGTCCKYIDQYILGEDKDGNSTNYITSSFGEEIRTIIEEEQETDDEGMNRYNSYEQYHKKVSIYEENKTGGVVLGTKFKESIAEWTIEGEPSGKIVTKAEDTQKIRQVISSNGTVMLETIQDSSLDDKPDGIVYNVSQGTLGDCWLLTELWWLGTLGVDLTKPYDDKSKPVIIWNKDGSCTVNLYDYRKGNNYTNTIQQTYKITKEELNNPIYLNDEKSIRLCTGDKTAKAIEIAMLKLGGLDLLNGGTTSKLFKLLFGESADIWEKENFTNPTIEDLQNAADLWITESQLKKTGLEIQEIATEDGIYKAGLIKDNKGDYVPAIVSGHALAIEPDSINNPPGYITIRNPWNNADQIYTIPIDWVMQNMMVDGCINRLKPEVVAKLNRMKTVTEYQLAMGNGSREEHPTSADVQIIQ